LREEEHKLMTFTCDEITYDCTNQDGRIHSLLRYEDVKYLLRALGIREDLLLPIVPEEAPFDSLRHE